MQCLSHEWLLSLCPGRNQPLPHACFIRHPAGPRENDHRESAYSPYRPPAGPEWYWDAIGRRTPGWLCLQTPGQTLEGNAYKSCLFDASQKVQGLPRWLSGKESASQCRIFKRRGFDPWVGKIPWRRTWQPTPVFLPGKSHEQGSLAGYSPWGCRRVGHDLATQQQEQKSPNVGVILYSLILPKPSCLTLQKAAHPCYPASKSKSQDPNPHSEFRIVSLFAKIRTSREACCLQKWVQFLIFFFNNWRDYERISSSIKSQGEVAIGNRWIALV